MNTADFIFTIGYTGNTAIIDKKARTALAKCTSEELLAKGLFKPALCAVLAGNDSAGFSSFLQAFNARTGLAYTSIDELKRLFGVYAIPEGVVRTTLL